MGSRWNLLKFWLSLSNIDYYALLLPEWSKSNSQGPAVPIVNNPINPIASQTMARQAGPLTHV